MATTSSRNRPRPEKRQKVEKVEAIDYSDSTNPFIPDFLVYRDRLDKYHDVREKTVKISRDVTANSKKLIFHLHRLPPGAEIKDDAPPPFLEDIKQLLSSIPSEMASQDPYRYLNSISPGIQEYMEAISFLHYLKHGTILTYAEAREHLPADIPLTLEDYCGGIFDLSGELMKLAVLQLAKDRSIGGRVKVLEDLRELRVSFERLDSGNGGRSARDWEGKLRVMKQSVEKVEGMVYGIVVRGNERPEGWIGDGPGDGDADRMEE